jgi:hypothetical protein
MRGLQAVGGPSFKSIGIGMLKKGGNMKKSIWVIPCFLIGFLAACQSAASKTTLRKAYHDSYLFDVLSDIRENGGLGMRLTLVELH